MKKRILSALLCAALLAGCSSAGGSSASKSSSSAFTAGTYSSSAKGYGGDVTVTITTDASSITDVKVEGPDETESVGGAALDKLADQIKEKQSSDIDGVSGATVTSTAAKEAAQQAINAAEGKETSETKGKAEDASADVVVVGGGLAGLAASLTAADNGADVILVEKQDKVGGSGLLTAAGFYAADTELVTDESVDEMYNHIIDMIQEGGNLEDVDPERIRHLCEESPKVYEWLKSLGGEFTTTSFGIKDAKSHYHILADGSNGPGQVKILEEACEKAGVDIRRNTKCTALLSEGETVNGITVESDDSTYNINAKAVILTCGGYANNQEMMMRLAPQSLFSITCSEAGSTGECLQMAADLGAKWYDDQFMLTCGFTSDPNFSELGMVCYPPYASMPVVDQTGHRFMNEFSLWTLNSNMVRNVENAPFWGIYDSTFLKGTDAEFKLKSMEDAVQAGSPYVAKADTLEELALKMGITDTKAFTDTIAAYNSVKGTSNPDPEYGVPNEQLSFVENGPFYGVLMVSLNAGTMGGIETQTTGEVLDYHQTVMPGLYAAGEASNGAIYARGYISGTSVLNCYVAGRDAGTSAAAYAGK